MSSQSQRRPGTEHLGLPGHFYYDQTIFDQELDSIWERYWQMVGRADEIPHNGDYLTAIVGRNPLLIIRGRDGALRAFHNICRHRGNLLLEDSGNCVALRCGYHGWTYNPDGFLTGVPQKSQFPELDTSSTRLLPVQSDIWEGFIFVNADTQAEPLHSHLAGFTTYLSDYEVQVADVRQIAQWRRDVPVNWKLLVENYVEHYHFPTLHGETLSQIYDHGRVQVTPVGDHCPIYIPFSADAPPSQMPGSARWKLSAGSYQGLIFPNLFVGTSPASLSIVRLTPVAPELTSLETVIYQTPAQTADSPFVRYDDSREMAEDFELCRRLQTTVHSKAYAVTTLGRDVEAGVRHFYEVYRRAMGI